MKRSMNAMGAVALAGVITGLVVFAQTPAAPAGGAAAIPPAGAGMPRRGWINRTGIRSMSKLTSRTPRCH